MKNFILTILSIFLILTSFQSSEAQWVTIPDSNFVTWLNVAHPSAMNGNQMDTTNSSIINATSAQVSGNNIANIDGIQFFDNLNFLECGNNQLTFLPQLPITLQVLGCGNNLLTSLPALPPSLQLLNCQLNQITFLPPLPTTLELLMCFENSLTSLPPLPVSLETLVCRKNQLLSLPALPNNITTFDCSNNQLTSLPPIPQSLTYLPCYNNQLTSLPTLPASLIGLSCFNNQLTSLPTLPPSIKNISCNNNLLILLPELPDSLTELYCHNNPDLNCFPRLKYINTVWFNNTNIQCLPNYGTVINSNPNISTLPLCDIFNLNGCDFNYNISGQVFAETNINCQLDSGENNTANVKVLLSQGGNVIQQLYSNSAGRYSFDTNLGFFTSSVDTAMLPYIVECPPSNQYVSFLSLIDSTDVDKDFGIRCKPVGYDIGARSVSRISGIFFPGNTSIIKINAGDMARFYDLNCTAGLSGVVNVTINGPALYAGYANGSLIPLSFANSLVYNIADFGNTDPNSSFIFYLITDTSAQAGQQICIDVSVSPVASDNNISNNNLTQCFIVANSFDPNFKESSPVDSISNSQEWITYTVNFQNTGNAMAQNIVITDTLDIKLQEATFTFLTASHNNYVQVIGNVVKFTFPNINLPDSTNDEPNSHGYLQYKVKMDAALAIGTTIENSAAIYFDFNAPVITNITTNTLVAPTGISEITTGFLSMFPNPASDILNIHSTNSSIHHVSMTDLTGRKIYENNFTGTELVIDIRNVASGVYFVNIENEEIRTTLKLIVR